MPDYHSIAMLEAYVDDSGTHEGSRAAVVAAFVASREQWARFESDWRRMLAEQGLSAFRMSDFENGWGEFRDWDPVRRQKVREFVFTTIKIRTQCRMATGIEVEAIRAVVPPSDDTRPYFWCVIELLKHIARWAGKYAPGQNIAYVFEDGTQGKGQIMEALDYVRRHRETWAKYHIASYAFGDKRKVVPLQAADVLAYECYKELTNRRLQPSNPRPRRRSLVTLLAVRHHLFFVDRPAMERMYADSDPEKSARLPNF